MFANHDYITPTLSKAVILCHETPKCELDDPCRLAEVATGARQSEDKDVQVEGAEKGVSPIEVGLPIYRSPRPPPRAREEGVGVGSPCPTRSSQGD